MRIEFLPAKIPADIRSLTRFDKKIFQTDAFPPHAWRNYEAWWMTLASRKIGCCAFDQNVDFRPNSDTDHNPHRPGSLYISTSGILPEFQGSGLGRLMKSWQIAYARHHSFNRIVTNSRKSNSAMIALNRSFGFKRIQTVPGYYENPAEAAVVMELIL